MKRTTNRKFFGVLCLIALMIVAPLAGYAQCNDRCRLPPKSERGECSVVIDANTGRIIEGSIRISDSCEQVQVYYVNKNPFKYSYTFTSTFVPFDTETALAFLKLIPDFGSTVSSIVEPQALPAASFCMGANFTVANKFKQRADALKTLSETLAADINTATTAYTNYKNRLTQFFTDTDSDNAFRSGAAGCTNLCDRARALLVEHANVPDLEALGKRIENLEDEFARLEKDVQAFTPTGANAQDCKDETVKDISERIARRREDVKNYKSKLAELKAAKTTLDQRTKIVRAGDSDSFVELVPAQRDDVRGGKLILTIARKNLRNPDVALDNRTVTLLVGDRNLFISAGIGFSTITDRRIIRQSGLVPDGNGGTKVGTVFGFEENSGFKPSGVIMLNAPLKRFNLFGNKDASIGPSTGLVLSNRNGTVEPEFIVGLSLGLLRDTMFITGGFHAARRENLVGFTFGQEVPEALTGALPIEKNFTGGAMFSITYRIK
jgi:hypothetical protein